MATVKKTAEPAKKAAPKKAAAPAKKPSAVKSTVTKIVGPKLNIMIQSPMGGEITPEQILAKIGEADKVYVRVDVNKAYWVKGDEAGSVDLW